MSATASSKPIDSRPAPQTERVELDATACLPFLGLVGNALLWLFVATLFGLITSLKFHNPHFLTGQGYWTYGRLHAAGVTSLLYGFGTPSALGVGLWLLCRLGRTPVVGPLVIFIGTLLWNLAVTVGVLAILCGDNTGYDGFEMPKYALGILMIGYLLIATCAILTFHRREETVVYPSQWFVLGTLFWFPWIATTAAMLLLCLPVRGVLQASTAWWFANSLSYVVLGFTALASILYIIPKILGRSLYSAPLAWFSLFFLALFGSFGGIPVGAPLPSWMVGLSLCGTILTIVPVLAIAWNLYKTAQHDAGSMDGDISLRFTYVALFFWMIANAQRVIGVIPSVAALTDYSWFGVAQWNLFHYGFFAFAIFGAIYYIAPRILDRTGKELPTFCTRLAAAHFWLMLGAVLISYVSLLVGGIGQGIALNNQSLQFPQIMAGTLMTLRVSTLGDLMLVVGTIVFLVNCAGLIGQVYRRGRVDMLPKKGRA